MSKSLLSGVWYLTKSSLSHRFALRIQEKSPVNGDTLQAQEGLNISLKPPLCLCATGLALRLTECFLVSACVCLLFKHLPLRPAAAEGGFHVKQLFIVTAFYRGRSNCQLGCKLNSRTLRLHRNRADAVILFG